MTEPTYTETQVLRAIAEAVDIVSGRDPDSQLILAQIGAEAVYTLRRPAPVTIAGGFAPVPFLRIVENDEGAPPR